MEKANGGFRGDAKNIKHDRNGDIGRIISSRGHVFEANDSNTNPENGNDRRGVPLVMGESVFYIRHTRHDIVRSRSDFQNGKMAKANEENGSRTAVINRVSSTN